MENTTTDYEQNESRAHFLRNIRQMKSNAVLLRQHEDGRLESVYVSDSFAKMMEYDDPDEALRQMDGMGFFRSTHPEDRPFERSVIKRRVTDDGSSDLTIQKITAKRNHIWCNVHYAFIDDFGEHYIYCIYSNVTVLKRYEERLKSVYTSLGSNFYQVDARPVPGQSHEKQCRGDQGDRPVSHGQRSPAVFGAARAKGGALPHYCRAGADAQDL